MAIKAPGMIQQKILSFGLKLQQPTIFTFIPGIWFANYWGPTYTTSIFL